MPPLLEILRKVLTLEGEVSQLFARTASPGSSVLSIGWSATLVHAGTAQSIPATTQKLPVDPTLGPVSLQFAGGAAPPDETVVIIKDMTGESGINPITLAAPTSPAGWTIENPASQGSFGASAQMATQGGCWWFQVIASQKTIVLIASA